MEPLTVESTQFYPQENSKENHTEDYDLVNNPDAPVPVFRRGCNFVFSIKFNREYDSVNDVVRVGFGFGPRPNVTRGTRAILPILPKLKNLPQHPKDQDRWSMCIQAQDAEKVTLQVHIPASAQVGIWNCTVQTNISGKRDKRNDYKSEEDIYIIFNPWCPEDTVYMKDEEDRKEYVLNETGKIWCGTFKNPKGKNWIFGQFDDICLPAAVFLLEKSGLDPADRGSPVLISRAISAVINSVDDGGLLEGKWDGNYGDGTSPHAWTGSTAIMDQYLRTGGQPVKYGQCWVFSGATVTVCRALGLPCRSVTNYVSAHDTNCSLTVDKYFDIFGNKIENGPEGDCKDSCWNFHVWNDVWMARPDLPPGYGGWQIIDATPQEKSDNVFRCGPASLEAVRKGEVGYLYDTPFVFTEVNADVVHFQEDEESDWGFSRMSINQYHVGRKILTKKPGPTDDKGDNDMWIVTNFYKNPEGTDAERLAVYNAVKGVPKAQHFYEIPNRENEDVFFDLVDIEAVPFGQNFDVLVHVENKANEDRTVTAALSASAIYYTGASANSIKKSKGTFVVKPGGKEILKLKVTLEEYIDKLVDHGLFKIYAVANVKETKQTWSEEDDFTMIKPEMTISVSGLCKVGEQCSANFSFQNPLNMSLSECVYTIEGPGMNRPKAAPFRKVNPKEIVHLTENFVPKKAGERTIVATFTSKQIQGITGSIKINVQ